MACFAAKHRQIRAPLQHFFSRVATTYMTLQ
jgi:hypothetical protein